MWHRHWEVSVSRESHLSDFYGNSSDRKFIAVLIPAEIKAASLLPLELGGAEKNAPQTDGHISAYPGEVSGVGASPGPSTEVTSEG